MKSCEIQEPRASLKGTEPLVNSLAQPGVSMGGRSEVKGQRTQLCLRSELE